MKAKTKAPIVSAEIEVERARQLAAQVMAGDRAARTALTEFIWSFCARSLHKSRPLRGLPDDDDHVHNVLTLLSEKLCSPNSRALSLYPAWQERHTDKTFADWLRIVAANAARDYARSRRSSSAYASPEEPPARGAPAQVSPKRLLNEFSNARTDELHHSVRPPFTGNQTARELLEFAVEHLEEDQLEALRHWLEGASFDEIAVELVMEPAQAQRLLRSAIARLRRRFSPEL